MIEKHDQITPHQAARMLGVCRMTIYRWADRRLHNEPSPVYVVYRQPNGRIVLSRKEISEFNRKSLFHGDF